MLLFVDGCVCLGTATIVAPAAPGSAATAMVPLQGVAVYADGCLSRLPLRLALRSGCVVAAGCSAAIYRLRLLACGCVVCIAGSLCVLVLVVVAPKPTGVAPAAPGSAAPAGLLGVGVVECWGVGVWCNSNRFWLRKLSWIGSPALWCCA